MGNSENVEILQVSNIGILIICDSVMTHNLKEIHFFMRKNVHD